MIKSPHGIILLFNGAMKTVQVKLHEEYHDKLQAYCRRFGVSKAELIRFMLDTMENWGVTDDEFNRWYDDSTSP